MNINQLLMKQFDLDCCQSNHFSCCNVNFNEHDLTCLTPPGVTTGATFATTSESGYFTTHATAMTTNLPTTAFSTAAIDLVDASTTMPKLATRATDSATTLTNSISTLKTLTSTATGKHCKFKEALPFVPSFTNIVFC